jgi:hypothetical protein
MDHSKEEGSALPVGVVLGSSVIYKLDLEKSESEGSQTSSGGYTDDEVSDPVPSCHLLFQGFVDGLEDFQTLMRRLHSRAQNTNKTKNKTLTPIHTQHNTPKYLQKI